MRINYTSNYSIKAIKAIKTDMWDISVAHDQGCVVAKNYHVPGKAFVKHVN